MKESIDFSSLDKFIEIALEEDIGSGDITANATVSDKEIAAGRVVAKENIVVCGMGIFKQVFHYLDHNIKIELHYSDGDKGAKGDILLNFSGNARSLLSGERVALNILQRLSGIATLTARFVQKVPNSVKILDTRKTTPGMRILEKYAVRCGGGANHRFGLYDAVLIKDNHIKAAGSITQAVEKIRKNVSQIQKIEIEAKNIEEVEEALHCGCHVILLDNMTPEQIKKAVSVINKRAKVEVSGNIGLHNIQEVAGVAGIDFISVGALTHSAPAVDISMIFNPTE